MEESQITEAMAQDFKAGVKALAEDIDKLTMLGKKSEAQKKQRKLNNLNNILVSRKARKKIAADEGARDKGVEQRMDASSKRISNLYNGQDDMNEQRARQVAAYDRHLSMLEEAKNILSRTQGGNLHG